MREVAQRLDLLNPKATVITVAGTNGKGSCIAALSCLLESAGQSYGAFTSPHIQHYNERVRLNGESVSDDLLCEAFDAIDVARGDISLTYFEFGTLAAYYIFAKNPVNYWLVEVGLGGRLDASNILDADIAIITSIALDHMEWLGDTREKIGAEKAGICRADRPLICADPDLPNSVLHVASEVGAQVFCLNKDFGVEVSPASSQTGTLSFWGQGYAFSLPYPHLPLHSLSAACEAYQWLWNASNTNSANNANPENKNSALPTLASIANTLVDLKLLGRFEEQNINGVTFVLDVAHNPAAMRHLCARVQRSYPGKAVVVVLAMMRDKNIHDSVENLQAVADAWYISTIEGMSRAASIKELSELVLRKLPDAKVLAFESISEAIDKARVTSELVLITGSFYCIEAAKTHLQKIRGA